MFENVNQAYNGTDATIEIIIMLLVAFVLGYLLRYFLEAASDETTTNDAPVSFAATEPLSTNQNDLKVVEGIGPKIEEHLKKEGIGSWVELARSDEEALRKLLDKAGDKFKIANPKSWPHQASLARDGKWAELKQYQDFLTAGRE